MSHKINIWFILHRHASAALKNADSNKISITDLMCFVFFPAAIGILVYILGVADKPATITLIVTVCAIFCRTTTQPSSSCL